ncbi:helix-turn-helix domain-containing protein [Roseovarius sp. MMSF_3281]|uniref:helix-turn-helix domain-containing protein n=1 Tax=Roseovarius sp. MMSF_3281 TaxID=3046694 RepID=UPI0035324BFD
MSLFLRYLKNTGQTKTDFAKRIGISQNYLSEISRGVRLPSYTVAYNIFKETHGEIPMSFWGDSFTPGQGISQRAINNSSQTKENANG